VPLLVITTVPVITDNGLVVASREVEGRSALDVNESVVGAWMDRHGG